MIVACGYITINKTNNNKKIITVVDSGTRSVLLRDSARMTVMKCPKQFLLSSADKPYHLCYYI